MVFILHDYEIWITFQKINAPIIHDPKTRIDTYHRVPKNLYNTRVQKHQDPQRIDQSAS